MSDNTPLSPGVGGDTIRDIDDGTGVKTQVVLLNIGTVGAESIFNGAVSISSGTISMPVGASTSALQGTGNTSVANIDTKTPALGQALAAASSPVVLTALQQAALTPPAAITGFALEAGNLATLVAKDFATQTTLATRALEAGGNLEAAATVLGLEADESIRVEETGSISARLRAISEQMDELKVVQKEGNEILFLILNALTSESKQEVN